MHYGDVEVLINNELYIKYKIDGKEVELKKIIFDIDQQLEIL